MPTPTHLPIANITLGANASTVTFSSISGSYRDLRLVIMAGNTGNGGLVLRVNSDSGSNYFYVAMRGETGGTFSNSANDTRINIGNNVYSQNALTLLYTVDFMDYSATDKHKLTLSRGNNGSSPSTANSVEAHANRWANTAAITSIQVLTTSGNIYAGSSFALYGILA